MNVTIWGVRCFKTFLKKYFIQYFETLTVTKSYVLNTEFQIFPALQHIDSSL